MEKPEQDIASPLSNVSLDSIELKILRPALEPAPQHSADSDYAFAEDGPDKSQMALVKFFMDNADLYHHRGQVYLLIEQIDNAIADFNKAVELNPEFPIAYVQKLYTDYRKASMENSMEKVNNIINMFEAAVQKFPSCVESYALFAQVSTWLSV